MTAGITHDMRRIALVSLVAHVVTLVALTTVPLRKIPPRGASGIEVLLVSLPSAPVQVVQAPVSQPKPTPPSPPAPPKTAPTPPTVAKATPAPHAVLLQKRLQEITVPKEVAPVLPMSKSPPQPVTAAPAEPLSPKPQSSRDLAEAFRKAEDALARLPVTKPLPPAQSPPPLSRTSEEINKLLDTLLPPTPVMPGDATPATKELAPAVARAPQGTTTVARPAAVERCPPKARAYCPLLEAAINRVWNADTNPAVRQVLESAGDSTSTMRIVIQPNGEIGNIALYKSSGNDAYDRAVESVLRELQRVPPLPDEMKGESFVAVTSFTYTKR
jgi:TonB family protein